MTTCPHCQRHLPKRHRPRAGSVIHAMWRHLLAHRDPVPRAVLASRFPMPAGSFRTAIFQLRSRGFITVTGSTLTPVREAP